jgi:hypothetical protein
LLLTFEPTPFWPLIAEGSLAGAVIKVLATIAISPVAFVVKRGWNGVMTERSARLSSTSADINQDLLSPALGDEKRREGLRLGRCMLKST